MGAGGRGRPSLRGRGGGDAAVGSRGVGGRGGAGGAGTGRIISGGAGAPPSSKGVGKAGGATKVRSSGYGQSSSGYGLPPKTKRAASMSTMEQVSSYTGSACTVLHTSTVLHGPQTTTAAPHTAHRLQRTIYNTYHVPHNTIRPCCRRRRKRRKRRRPRAEPEPEVGSEGRRGARRLSGWVGVPLP